MAKVMLLGLLTHVLSQANTLHLRNVIDDVSVQSIGTRRLVSAHVGGAMSEIFKGCEKLQLPVSFRKCAIQGSSLDLEEEILDMKEQMKSCQSTCALILAALTERGIVMPTQLPPPQPAAAAVAPHAARQASAAAKCKAKSRS